MVKGIENGPLQISGGVKVLDHKVKKYGDVGDVVAAYQKINLTAMAATQW
jgi:hypothetical protein